MKEVKENMRMKYVAPEVVVAVVVIEQNVLANGSGSEGTLDNLPGEYW